MEAAGLDAPPEEIDALFEHFDPENKGSFDYVDPARPARPEPNPVPDPNSIYGRTPLYYNEGEKCVPVYIYAGGTTLDAYKVRVRVRVRVRVSPNPNPNPNPGARWWRRRAVTCTRCCCSRTGKRSVAGWARAGGSGCLCPKARTALAV